MLLGARVIKTGIAVTISMYICYVFNIQPAIFAGAATVVNLQPSVVQSLSNAKEQVFVHFMAIGVAIALGLTLGPHAVTMGISAVIIITICNKLGIKQGIAMGIVASIFILDSPPTEFLDHAFIRSLAIFIGLTTALVVNVTIAPPHYKDRLVDKLKEINGAITDAFNDGVTSYFSLNIISEEEWQRKKSHLKGLVKEGEALYNLYTYEAGYGLGSNNKDRLKDKTILFYKEYLTYSKGLIQRTSDIHFLALERKNRRTQRGDLPVSPHFQEILDLLEEVHKLFIYYNQELSEKLDKGISISHVSPPIWNRIDTLLAHWHDRFPAGSYYLHALIEVSLITYKINWATTESIRLLQAELE